MKFKRSRFGVLVPESSIERSGWRARVLRILRPSTFSTLINAFIALIQLATIWILWKTYQDTVIPNRQKELLSEQVANLELERVATSRAIKESEGRIAALNRELLRGRKELQTLSQERERLISETAQATANAERAGAAESAAELSAREAENSLRASQWSIYHLNASLILSIPSLRMIGKLGELERASIGARDPKKALKNYLEGLERIWPDMTADAQLVVEELLKDDSTSYPNWMKKEFADHLKSAARNMNCPKPDFSAIYDSLEAQFDAAIAQALVEASKKQKEREQEAEEALQRNVRLEYPESIDQHERWVAISNATYKIADDVEERMSATIKACNEQLEQAGEEFFLRRGITSPELPQAISDEFY